MNIINQNRCSRALIVLMMLGLCGGHLAAQIVAPQHRRAVRAMIEEKMRINADSLQVYLSDPDGYRQRHHAEINGKLKAENSAQSIDNLRVSSPSAYEMEVHAVVNPTDSKNIVCAAIAPTVNPLVCSIYYSRDGGTTWAKSAFRTLQHGGKGTMLGGGDPVFAFDAAGNLYFSWIDSYLPTNDKNRQNMEAYWVKSTNGGESFQRDETKDGIFLGKVVNQDYTDPQSEVADKQWIMCDNSNSPFRGNLYAALLQTKGNDWFIKLRRKTAQSDQFDTTAVAALVDDISYGQQCSIDVDTLGRVHVGFCANLKSDTCNRGKWYWRLYDAVSTDGGLSFEGVHPIATAFTFAYDSTTDDYLGLPAGAASADALPQIVCDKRSSATRKATNNMYCAWSASGVDSLGTRGLDTYFARSTDGGKTWSTPRIVNDDFRQGVCTQAYVSMAVSDEGVIVLTWYDRRVSTDDKRGEYYMALSFDNGLTFSKNFSVSSKVTTFSQFTGAFARATGEYNQVVTTNGEAMAFWGDGRNGTMQIYMARVPLDSTSTSVKSYQTLNFGWGVDNVSPNPVHQECTIQTQSSLEHILEVDVCSEDGRSLSSFGPYTVKSGVDRITLDLSSVPAGAYFIRLGQIDGKRGNFVLRPIVKQ